MENTKTAASVGEETVKLKITGSVVDVFDPSIEGISPITKAGTSIPAEKEAEIKKSARGSGVSISRVRK